MGNGLKTEGYAERDGKGAQIARVTVEEDGTFTLSDLKSVP